MAKPAGKPKATSPSVTTGSSSYTGSLSASGRGRGLDHLHLLDQIKSPPAKTSDDVGPKKIRSSSTPPKKFSLVKKLCTPTPESTVLHVGCLTRNVNKAHLKEIFDHWCGAIREQRSFRRQVRTSQDPGDRVGLHSRYFGCGDS